MNITLLMVEEYGSLRAYDESFRTAIRCGNPAEIVQIARQLLEFRIPEFRRVFSEGARQGLVYGSNHYLCNLEISARAELTKHAQVDTCGLNRAKALY